jgi:hypothetical protein
MPEPALSKVEGGGWNQENGRMGERENGRLDWTTSVDKEQKNVEI